MVSMSVLCSVLMCTAMAQGYSPPEFLLDADYDIGKSTLRVSAERRAAAPADAPRPKLDRWRIADGRFQIRIVRLGGQGRVPSVLGLEKPLADPATFFDWGQMQNDPSRVVYGDYTYTQFPLDRTGCKPGYYKITVTAALEIEGRGRLDQDVFQVVYWQPTPPPSTFVRVGQKFLSTTIRGLRGHSRRVASGSSSSYTLYDAGRLWRGGGSSAFLASALRGVRYLTEFGCLPLERDSGHSPYHMRGRPLGV